MPLDQAPHQDLVAGAGTVHDPQAGHPPSAGLRFRAGDPNHVAAASAVVEEGADARGQVGDHRATAVARQHQIAAEDTRVTVRVFEGHRDVERAAFGEADEGGHIQPDRGLPFGHGDINDHSGEPAVEGEPGRRHFNPYSTTRSSIDSTSSSTATSVPVLALRLGAV